MNIFKLKNEQSTRKLAGAIAQTFHPGMVIGLSGELGAGKTTFVRYLVECLGGDLRLVSSPTYTLQHEYKLPNGLTFEHWDLYRLKVTPLELEHDPSSNCVRLIEWPEKCPDLIESLTFQIRISAADESGDEEERLVEILGDDVGQVIECVRESLGS